MEIVKEDVGIIGINIEFKYKYFRYEIKYIGAKYLALGLCN